MRKKTKIHCEKQAGSGACYHYLSPSREVRGNTALDVFKIQLDKALNTLISRLIQLGACGWTKEILRLLPA